MKTGLVAAAIAASLGIFPARAETHALVIGMDHYAGVTPLKGADADAADITSALKKRGVKDLTTLIDSAVTRDRLLEAFDRMIGRVKRDDLVIVSFAGHGSQEIWGKIHPPGVKEGEGHEVFLLTGFARPNALGNVDPSEGSARERIMGVEIAARLAALDAKGARTIFVADTCHGGGLTREPPLEGAHALISIRTLPAYRFAAGQDPLTSLYAHLPAPIDTDHELPALTFLAGVDRDHSVPEVEIPLGSSKSRGALSYAFARVIEGTAPTAKPGVMTRGELVDYVNATVRTQARNLQEPDLRPRADFDRVVVDFARDMPDGASSPPTDQGSATISASVSIFILGGAATSLPTTSNNSIVLRPAQSKEDADLLFDPAAHTIHSASGDLIASDVGPTDLPGVAAREVAHRRLLALSLSRPRDLKLAGGDGRYSYKDMVGIDTRPSTPQPDQAEYYVLFNISGTGLVQFLYPKIERRDATTLSPDRPLDDISVQPPYGNDTLVLVTSPAPIDALVAAVRKLDDRPAAMEAVDLIEKALTPNMRIGLQGVFTSPVK